MEAKMLVPVSVMILTSQLVVAVSDDVPKFNIARGCKVDSTSAFDLNAGLNETIKQCVSDEQKAKDQLQAQWPEFPVADRKMCGGEVTDDSSIPPSYVELLVCLQDQQLARKLPKQ
jgi:hypothetical protein